MCEVKVIWASSNPLICPLERRRMWENKIEKAYTSLIYNDMVFQGEMKFTFDFLLDKGREFCTQLAKDRLKEQLKLTDIYKLKEHDKTT
jgi:hypothetical protein